MSGFTFTSLHRPVGSSFVDFSICPVDDSSYDESRGPECLIHHCIDYEESEDYLLSNASDESDDDDYYYHYCDNLGEDYFTKTFVDYLIELQEKHEKELCSACPQYGHGRVELGAEVSRDSRKNNCEWNPKRNRGRKPRTLWESLAGRVREKKRMCWGQNAVR